MRATERFSRRPDRNGNLDVLVLDGEQRQSLVCVRSLGRHLRVGAFSSHVRSPALSSHWCAASGLLPDCGVDQDAYVAAVLALVEKHSPRVLITAHDGPLEALRARRDEFGDRTTLALASNAALDIAVDKTQTLALADQLGIPTPRTVPVHDVSDVAAAASAVGFPVVVKPVRSWVRQGELGERLISVVAVDLDEACRAVDRVLAPGGSVVLQEWLPGAREAIWLFNSGGRMLARFAQIAYRMYPPLGGSSVLRESIPLPRDLVDASEALVVAAGLEGYSEVEFRRDSQGTARLMEINPRLSASIEVAVRAGIDFPKLIYASAAGSPVPEQHDYRYGVRMRWLGGDVRWLRDTLRMQGRPDIVPAGRATASFIADCFRPTGYDYLTASDLRPAVVAVSEFVLQGLGRRNARSGGSPKRRT